MNTVELHNGDCLAVLMGLPSDSIDAIVTDPPYGLAFMGKRWDYDVPSVDVWAECLRVLKPGGHLLAFAGTRTQHRMAVRIEDAGFEIRDMIAWVYGSGFPKSRDVSKDMDRIAGAEREVIGKIDAPGMARTNVEQGAQGRSVYTFDRLGGPVSDAARQWAGWGTALKPALEPITVARKPLAGTVAENVMRYGTGGLNIDGCRVAGEGNKTFARDAGDRARDQYRTGTTVGAAMPTDLGRWPANLIHDGSEEVLAAFPQASGAVAPVRGNEPSGKTDNAFGEFAGRAPSDRRDGGGSAARFFYCAKASKRDRDEGLEMMPVKPAGSKNVGVSSGRDPTNPRNTMGQAEPMRRNHHPTVKPTDLMRYLCRLVTPPGGVVLDPFAGSGSTGKAAILEGFRFIGIEREAEYVEIARARIKAVMPKTEPPVATEPQFALFP